MPNIYSKPTEEHTIGVAVNRCYGGFSLSEKAVEILRTRIGDPNIKCYSFDSSQKYPRHHPILIEVIKELGEEADGCFSEIVIEYIEEIYKDFYSISEYDGMEGVNINFNRFRNEQLKNILYSEETDSIKVIKMKEILK
jgi:hypothetical protein